MKIMRNKPIKASKRVMASVSDEEFIVREALAEYGYSKEDIEEIIEDGSYTYYEGSSNGSLGEAFIENLYGSVDALEDEVRELLEAKYGSEIAYAFHFDADGYGLSIQTNYGGIIPADNGWVEVTD